MTTAVWLELADADPAAFVAVTAMRIVEPTSELASAYVFDVAPLMSVQLLPPASHRRHWYAIVGPVPDQPPAVAESRLPCFAWPVTVGAATFAGATSMP